MKLKSGFTTGTCAAAASKAAARMIFDKRIPKTEIIITPNGTRAELEITDCIFENKSASCGIKKYSGDDPDVTNGIMIYSRVSLTDEKEIKIDGGRGIGRITKKGLWQNIGEAAINKVPREMIKNAVKEIFDLYGYNGGAEIIISSPDGEEIAKRTLNERLGIVGGISILGTGGTVEPMSSNAIIASIKAEMNVKRANDGEYIMLAPGNYAMEFIKKELCTDIDNAVKCSNFMGEALDFAVEAEFKGIVIIGHIGKLVKLAGGIMNTHSKNADCRMEIIAANAALVCESTAVPKKIMACITTDEAIEILKENNICTEAMKKITEKAMYYIKKRTENKIRAEIVFFSDKHGILGESSGARELINKINGRII